MRYESDESGGSQIRIAAMDLGWHLTSCHATPLFNTEHITLTKLLEGLIDPTWGFAGTTEVVNGKTVPIIVLGNVQNRTLKQGRAGVKRAQPRNPLDVLPYIQVEPGQTPMDILETYLKREGFLLNVSAKGELVLFQPDYQQQSSYDGLHLHSAKSKQRDLNNVKHVEMTDGIDGLYSSTECWSTVVIPQLAQQEQKQLDPNADYTHTVYQPLGDPPVPFNRRYAFMDGEAINEVMRTNRAVYAYQMGSFNSWEYTATVAEHASNGARYVSDTMLSVTDEIHNVSGMLYVQRVQRSVTNSRGTEAVLTLKLPGMLDPSLQQQVTAGAKKPSQKKKPQV